MAGGMIGKVAVPAIAFGTSGLGGMPDTYGYDVGEERALATVRAVLARPDGFIDTLAALRHRAERGADRRGDPRARRLARGAGALDQARPRPGDRALRRGAGAALARGEPGGARPSTGSTSCTCTTPSTRPTSPRSPAGRGDRGAVPDEGGGACRRGRARGGPGRRDDADAARLGLRRAITHNRFTLVNRNAEPMIDSRRSAGIAVMNAAPYAGGVLAKGAAQCPLRLPGGRPRRCSRRCAGSRRSAPATACRRARRRCNSRCATRGSRRRSAA